MNNSEPTPEWSWICCGSPAKNPEFGYNAASVRWVDGFIERQRVREAYDEAELERLIQNLGRYMGECVIAVYGGNWAEVNGMWAIAFDAENAAFPFNKVRKQFESGAEESVESWFRVLQSVVSGAFETTDDTFVEPRRKPWWKRKQAE